jgi:hypothetical protein
VGLLRRTRVETAPIREDEAYERLHGERSGDILRVVTLGKPPEPELEPEDLTGEDLRRAFETKLDARE